MALEVADLPVESTHQFPAPDCFSVPNAAHAVPLIATLAFAVTPEALAVAINPAWNVVSAVTVPAVQPDTAPALVELH
ncbi:MAG: hypothetical protein UX43_C0028G0007 [Candidatus Giovannonibacteria bacterium GW2011_GWB1_46_20]|nr:MAG: hypothetical protein UX43_C0028G0007 [Candidatus Giovannonibacteria bacterium GW2011_GWB1_46_20]